MSVKSILKLCRRGSCATYGIAKSVTSGNRLKLK
jgi:hypothetical protein